MSKIYTYKTRTIVEFSNKERASYSNKRYGPLLEKIVSLSAELDRKVWNYYEIIGDLIFIHHYNKAKNKIEIFFTDLEFADFIVKNNFCTTVSGYAYTSDVSGKANYLHWIAAGFGREEKEKTGLVVDHINQNKFDNRKENLRIVTVRENNTNQTGQMSKGVVRTPCKEGWRARWSKGGVDFQESFFGENAKEKAILKRIEKMKETGYLITFNDYSERK